MNDRIRQAYEMMDACALCPRACGANRRRGERGFCGVGSQPVVSSAGPHLGEEPPLVGYFGSGTIFFAGCNLGCVFCQNFDISHGRAGRETSVEGVVELMLRLEAHGCCNINFLTPTHVMPHVLDAIAQARGRGLRVPIVYNCGGYESLDALRLLEGAVEIYMPDAKFLDPRRAGAYCKAPDYPDAMKAALREMHRQVGDLEIVDGIARRGLLVRHLVMPNATDDGKAIIDFLADEISPDTYVNVMEQYRPLFRAGEHPAIARRPTRREFEEVYEHARRRGLRLAR